MYDDIDIELIEQNATSLQKQFHNLSVSYENARKKFDTYFEFGGGEPHDIFNTQRITDSRSLTVLQDILNDDNSDKITLLIKSWSPTMNESTRACTIVQYVLDYVYEAYPALKGYLLNVRKKNGRLIDTEHVVMCYVFSVKIENKPYIDNVLLAYTMVAHLNYMAYGEKDSYVRPKSKLFSLVSTFESIPSKLPIQINPVNYDVVGTLNRIFETPDFSLDDFIKKEAVFGNITNWYDSCIADRPTKSCRPLKFDSDDTYGDGDGSKIKKFRCRYTIYMTHSKNLRAGDLVAPAKRLLLNYSTNDVNSLLAILPYILPNKEELEGSIEYFSKFLIMVIYYIGTHSKPQNKKLDDSILAGLLGFEKEMYNRSQALQEYIMRLSSGPQTASDETSQYISKVMTSEIENLFRASWQMFLDRRGQIVAALSGADGTLTVESSEFQKQLDSSVNNNNIATIAESGYAATQKATSNMGANVQILPGVMKILNAPSDQTTISQLMKLMKSMKKKLPQIKYTGPSTTNGTVKLNPELQVPTVGTSGLTTGGDNKGGKVVVYGNPKTSQQNTPTPYRFTSGGGQKPSKSKNKRMYTDENVAAKVMECNAETNSSHNRDRKECLKNIYLLSDQEGKNFLQEYLQRNHSDLVKTVKSKMAGNAPDQLIFTSTIDHLFAEDTKNFIALLHSEITRAQNTPKKVKK